jgi:UDP-glucose 4-epimerase
MSRVLVTGGAGFIGANLVRALLDDGTDVRILDDLSTGRREYLADLPLAFVHGSVTDRDAVRRACRGTDAIVHLAAMSGVAQSVAHPARDFEVNVRGTYEVLDAARRAGVGRMVLASSGAMLAGAKPPLHEGLVPRPLAPYGASKLYGEAALEAFSQVYGMTGVALRLSNVYGPFSGHKQSVVAAFLRRARGRRPFPIYGSGRQTRDFLYVDDVTSAIQRALGATAAGTYQLGTGVETTILALARLVAEVAGMPLRIDRRPPRPGEATRTFSDIALARSKLGWKPQTTLREGLERVSAWMSHR